MWRKKIVVPIILVGIGIGGYLYIEKREIQKEREVVHDIEVEATNEELLAESKYLESASIDELKKEKKVSKAELPRKLKEINAHIEVMSYEVEEVIEEIKEEKEQMQLMDEVVEEKIAMLDRYLQPINEQAGIDVEGIKINLESKLTVEHNIEEIPEALAKSLSETDSLILEMEERADKLKERMFDAE